MTCDLCPAEAVVFAPGSAPVRDLFLLDGGEPLHCWCLACWLRTFGVAEARAREQAE